MIAPLTEQEWQTNEAIARRLNVVIEAVEALRRMFEQHIAAEVGADPADDEADPVEGDTLDLDDIEARAHRLMVATWECDKLSYTDQWQMVRCDVPALVAAVRSLRAERDAAQARVAELEALCQAGQDYANARCQERSELVAEIDKWKAKAKALEPDVALGEE